MIEYYDYCLQSDWFIGHDVFATLLNETENRIKKYIQSMEDTKLRIEKTKDYEMDVKKYKIQQVMDKNIALYKKHEAELQKLHAICSTTNSQSHKLQAYRPTVAKLDIIANEVISYCKRYQNILDRLIPVIITLQLDFFATDNSQVSLRDMLQENTQIAGGFQYDVDAIQKSLRIELKKIQEITATANSKYDASAEHPEQETLDFVSRLFKMVDPRVLLYATNYLHKEIQSLLGHRTNPPPSEHTHTHTAETGHPRPMTVSVHFHAELIRFAQALLAAAFPPTPTVAYHERLPPNSRGARPALPAAIFPAAACPALHALCARVAHVTAVAATHLHLAAARFALELGEHSALVRLARKEVSNALARATPGARVVLENNADALKACLADSALRLVLVAARSTHQHTSLGVVSICDFDEATGRETSV